MIVLCNCCKQADDIFTILHLHEVGLLFSAMAKAIIKKNKIIELQDANSASYCATEFGEA